MKCLRRQIHDRLFKCLSSAIKEASFGKPLLIYLKTLWQVTKMDHAQGQMQCLNTCMLFPCQNLFPSYFLSLWQVLSFFRALVTVSQQMYSEHKRYSLRWTCCLLICCLHQAGQRCCQNSMHSILMGIVYERSKKKLYRSVFQTTIE